MFLLCYRQLEDRTMFGAVPTGNTLNYKKWKGGCDRMDILTTRYERKNMSEKPKKFEKKNVLYLVIAGLAVIIIILLVFLMTRSNNSGATTAETGATAKVSSSASSSSTKKYVEGKDYTVTYSNTNLIDKKVLQSAVKVKSEEQIHYLMNTSEDGGNMAKILGYYNQKSNILVFKYYENGYKSDDDFTVGGYDLNSKTTKHDIQSSALNGLPLVYTWINNDHK